MSREQRAESLDSIVTDDSEDPLTCPLTQRLFHDPVILVASGVTYDQTPSTRPEKREAQESKLVQPNLPLRERLAPLRPRAERRRADAEGGAERV